MQGNLKFMLNKPFNGKHVKHFRSDNGSINVLSAFNIIFAHFKENKL